VCEHDEAGGPVTRIFISGRRPGGGNTCLMSYSTCFVLAHRRTARAPRRGTGGAHGHDGHIVAPALQPRTAASRIRGGHRSGSPTD